MVNTSSLSYIQNKRETARIKDQVGVQYFDIKVNWAGMADSVAPGNLPDLYTRTSINNVAFGSYLEKAPGSEKFGCQKDGKSKNQRGIAFDYFVDQAGRKIFWKIVDNGNGDNSFYVMRDEDGDGKIEGDEYCWVDATPAGGIGQNGEYDYAVWRNQLFFVSGEEYTAGGTTGCILRYDPTNLLQGDWVTIDTGNGVKNVPGSTGADGPEKFCPRFIEFNDDRMWVAGSERHCQQVKLSEHGNPYNLVGSATKPFLGLLSVPPDIEDLTRPSTFILDQNGDCITSLQNKGNLLHVVTNNTWWKYENLNVLNSSSLPAGLLWLDTLTQHPANTGSFSPKTVISDDEAFNFLSTSSTNPSLSTLVPNYATEDTDSVYANLSVFQQKRFRDINWDNAAMGKYGNGSGQSITMMSGSKCGDHNDTTLAYKQMGDTATFTEIDYIHAQDWAEDNDYTYWLASDSGDVWRITPDNWSICPGHCSDGEPDTHYPFIVQLGRAGLGAKDLPFSDKRVQYIWVEGAADENTAIQLDIFVQDTSCSGCSRTVTVSFVPCFNTEKARSDIPKCKDSTADPFTHQGGREFANLVSVEKHNINYNIMDIKLTAYSEGYFALHKLGTFYEMIKPVSSEMIAKNTQEGPIDRTKLGFNTVAC